MCKNSRKPSERSRGRKNMNTDFWVRKRREKTLRPRKTAEWDGTATAYVQSRKLPAHMRFCLEHDEEHFKEVTNLDSRKNNVRKYDRCFICIKKICSTEG